MSPQSTAGQRGSVDFSMMGDLAKSIQSTLRVSGGIPSSGDDKDLAAELQRTLRLDYEQCENIIKLLANAKIGNENDAATPINKWSTVGSK